MKKYAITIEHKGAVIIVAKTKKAAIEKFQEQGYKVSKKDVYLY